MTTSYAPFRLPPLAADTSRWLPVVCPACHRLARALPAGRDAMAMACDGCGRYRLTCAAGDVFDNQPDPIDREQLSEAVQDTCLMAECEWPLIDGLTAGALVGLAALPRPARIPAQSGGSRPWAP